MVGFFAVAYPGLPKWLLERDENRLSAGAARGTRTPDPVITNDVLYQLSYCGEPFGNGRITRPPDIGHDPDWQEKRG